MAVRSPTTGQLLGLGVTLLAVALFCGFSLWQVHGLRELQAVTLERGRRDSLQLVRIQNDLMQIGLTLHDMQESATPYGIAAYRTPLRRLREDLDDALEVEARLAPSTRGAGQAAALRTASARFWSETEAVLRLAESGNERGARTRISTRLEGPRAALSGLIARQLVQNNEAEAAAVEQVGEIYRKAEANIYLFLGAVLAAIAITGYLVLRFNRRVFNELERLSERRRELAAKVITVQEETFRLLAREIHDEFGQVLTAMGMMLARVEKKLPEELEKLRADLREVREIAQQTLERARTLSQMLHPPVLDDYGLEGSVEWYLGQFRRQTGIDIHYEKTGAAPFVRDEMAIHVYRIVQEALSNVARHAQVREAWVRARYAASLIEVEIEDHGVGMPAEISPGSIGLVGMRERAALLRGNIEFSRPESGGTRVELRIPLRAGG